MTELNLEALAKRVDELEHKFAKHEKVLGKDWRQVAGMFTGSEFSKLIDEEARKLREADREAATLEFGE